MMQVVDLFSGIGGFSLAARWMNWQTIQFCEIDKFCQKVLSHHFPGTPIHGDIKTLNYDEIRSRINPKSPVIVVGGFPCQPYSLAGKRLGKEDERHLWPYCVETIKQLQPDYCVFENVFGIINWSGGLVFDEVQSDLEAEGYEVQAYVLPACAVNAPHRRDRVWFVAHTTGNGTPQNGHSGANERGRETFIFSQDEGREIKTIQSAGLCGLQRDASDPTRKQNQRHGQGRFYTQPAGADEQGPTPDPASEGREERQQIGGWANSAKNRTGLVNGIERPFDDGLAPDPRSVGMSGQPTDPGTSKNTGQGRESVAQDGNAWNVRRWEGFPTTQPTIRRGDDGLSGRLDGITFSKWRNESIKAYGNAVVPQVVYEIFKAIQEYEKL